MDQLDADLRELNLSFLRLFREFARQDKVLAAEKFGMNAHFTDRVARATTEDLRTLANSSSFLFQPRSNIALDVTLTAIIAPGITTEQVNSIRAASLLSEGRAREGVA